MRRTKHVAIQNKESVKRFYAELNRGNFAILDELLSTEMQDHASHGVTSGLEAFRQFSAAAGAAFPDMQFHLEDLVAEGNPAAADVLWLALLPPGTPEPCGELVQHRRVIPFYTFSGD